MFVYRLSEPIDLFDGLIPMGDWVIGDPGRAAWALQAVLALTDAADALGWQRDMRHLPMVGGLPVPGRTMPYMIVKQDNNGDCFIISALNDIQRLDERARSVEVADRPIGAWSPADDDEYMY